MFYIIFLWKAPLSYIIRTPAITTFLPDSHKRIQEVLQNLEVAILNNPSCPWYKLQYIHHLHHGISTFFYGFLESLNVSWHREIQSPLLPPTSTQYQDTVR